MSTPILKEFTNNVELPDGRTLEFNDAPNMAYIVYRNLAANKISYVYSKNWKDGMFSTHVLLMIRLVASGIAEEDIDILVTGRVWTDEKISSTNQPKEEVLQYKTAVEKIFDENGLDMLDFMWDFSDIKPLQRWPDMSSTFKKPNFNPLDLKQLNSLVSTLHITPPGNEKLKIRNRIKDLQKKMGISNDSLESSIESSLNALNKTKGKYNSVAQANYSKGAIAESTVFKIYNKTLDPKIWHDDMVIDPDVRKSMLQIARDFYKDTDLKGEIKDILFLGSSANFNWTPTSDVDIHVVIDISEHNIPNEHQRGFMDGLASKWNNNHQITIKGHPVEVYLQDCKETNSTAELAREGAAIFSLIKNEWLKTPDKSTITLDKEKIVQKYNKIKNMISDFIKGKDEQKLKSLMSSLKNFRNDGLGDVGEFSTENLVFKALRHTGEIEKLKTAINTIYDKSASVDEVIEEKI